MSSDNYVPDASGATYWPCELAEPVHEVIEELSLDAALEELEARLG